MIFPLSVAAYGFTYKGVILSGHGEWTGCAFIAEKGIMDTASGCNQPRVNDFFKKKLILIVCICWCKALNLSLDILKNSPLTTPHTAHDRHAVVRVIAHNVSRKVAAPPFINSGLFAKGQTGIGIAHDDALNIFICQRPETPEHAAVVIEAAYPDNLSASRLQAACDTFWHAVAAIKTRNPSRINFPSLLGIDNRALSVLGVVTPE